MKKTLGFRILSAALAVFLILPMYIISASAETMNMEQTDEAQRVNTINALLDAQCSLDAEDPDNASLLEKIEMQLAALGVESLTEEEVIDQFPEAYAAVYGISLDAVTMAVPTPESNANYWNSYTSYYTHTDNNTYEIQRLVATPKNDTSPLRLRGNKTMTLTGNWPVGSTNLITAQWRGITMIYRTNTYSAYNVLKNSVEGMTTTSVLVSPSATYTWKDDTTASFAFVQPAGATDSQIMSFIAVSCKTYVTCSTSGTIQSASGAFLGTSASGSVTYYTTPSGYQSPSAEVEAYLSGEEGWMSVYLNVLTAPGGREIVELEPCAPFLFLDVEP